ncbi:hypothetical protein D3C87_1716080 [compost metagenome]
MRNFINERFQSPSNPPRADRTQITWHEGAMRQTVIDSANTMIINAVPVISAAARKGIDLALLVNVVNHRCRR